MMDPEMMRLAQEQMSKISPGELAKMMSNPELIKLATESMNNMRPEDLRKAAEQLKHTKPEDMVEMTEKMAKASPEEIAALRLRADAYVSYEFNAAEMLKKEGNDLHSRGKFSEAAQKYLHAKNNLKNVPVKKGKALQLACSLNLMSCYLKTMQYEDCVKEGSEDYGWANHASGPVTKTGTQCPSEKVDQSSIVPMIWNEKLTLLTQDARDDRHKVEMGVALQYDGENVKALYRRGQAYKALGKLKAAVADLRDAHRISPDDETIADVLRDAEEKLTKGVLIEEITEEEDRPTPSQCDTGSSSAEYSVTQVVEECSRSDGSSSIQVPTTEAECLQGLKDNPEAIRSFQNFLSNADPDALTALNAGGMPPEMIKTASTMISKMPPEDLQKMLEMASSANGKGPIFPMAAAGAGGHGSTPGLQTPPGMSPDMFKTASDMIGKMSPEELQKMFEVAASLKDGSIPATSSASSHKTNFGFPSSANTGTSAVSESSGVGGSFENRGTGSSSLNIPTSTTGLQEQMRNQMKDPAMCQMFTSMMKNMSPDMMTSMSEQFGVKLSREEAAKAQQAMSSMSPEDLDRMMRWAERIQKAADGARQTKNWLLGRPGMILAICMLILAIILHRLGFIGG
ncbi:hypothetical protein ACLOJK_005659 [Asimina triloba]